VGSGATATAKVTATENTAKTTCSKKGDFGIASTNAGASDVCFA
jgi:hypothetical protein